MKSRFRLTEDYLELMTISGLLKKKIPLEEIKRVKFIDKTFPEVANINNPLALILWDKKFKRIKQLELHNEKGRIAKIDGHFVDDKEFEKLRKKLK